MPAPAPRVQTVRRFAVYFSQRVHVFPFVQHTRGQPQDVSCRPVHTVIPNFGNFLLIHVKAAVAEGGGEWLIARRVNDARLMQGVFG